MVLKEVSAEGYIFDDVFGGPPEPNVTIEVDEEATSVSLVPTPDLTPTSSLPTSSPPTSAPPLSSGEVDRAEMLYAEKVWIVVCTLSMALVVIGLMYLLFRY